MLKFKCILFTLLNIIHLFSYINNQPPPQQIFCEKEVCFAQGGECNKEGRCSCYESFTTDDRIDNHMKCDYKQVSSFKAGFLELITGAGFGHLYAGRKGIGIFKLFCICLFCSCFMTTLVLIKKIRDETEAEDHPYVTLLVLIASIFKSVMIIWQIVDGVLFFLKFYKDGKGMPMY